MNEIERHERLPGLSAALLDLLLPRRCAACEMLLREPVPFCEPCAITLEPIHAPCPRCGLPGSGATCLSCLGRPPPHASAVAPLVYGGQLAVAIRRLKYGARSYLAPNLADLMIPCLADPCLTSMESLIPVPLHRRRLRQRGYNQAALLLGRLSPLLPGRPCWTALRRVKPGPRQTVLGRSARLGNLQGAFRADPVQVRGRRVLLVDDVMTTGATAAACSSALVKAGARQVRVLTLARAMA